MSKRKPKYSIPRVIDAIRIHRGLLYNAALSLGCPQATLSNYGRRYPEVKRAIEESRGQILDIAESKLYFAIEAGEPWAITFILRTLGKHRGYHDTREESPTHGAEFSNPYDALERRIASIIAARTAEADTREILN